MSQVRAWALHLSVPRQSCLRLEQGTWRQLFMQLYLLVLALMWLEYVDADVRAAGRLLPAAREGRALALQQWLSLPMGPGCSEGSGTSLGIASVRTAPAALHAALPTRTRAHGAGVCECRCSCSRADPTCGSRGQSSCLAAVAELAVVAWLQRRVRYALGHCICQVPRQ
jgi:hypothetical protein